MSIDHLRFSTDLLRRLGEELNQGADQGILELIRNAYDADANTCTVTLEGIDEAGGAFKVEDDGDGMDLAQIRQSWLILGRSTKDEKRRTKRKKRYPIGNKGIGRLAALRLGGRAELTTRPRKDPTSQLTLDIDWGKFDAADLVEEVPLLVHESTRTKGVSSGTEIWVRGLREPIGQASVSKLARAMVLLADPFSGQVGGLRGSGFRPILKAPGFEHLESLVDGRYFDQAEFRLHAEVDSRGNAQAVAYDRTGREVYSADHKALRTSGTYKCPPAVFDLWIYLLSKSGFTVTSGITQGLKAWLRDAGGVHLYHRGLRVLPYSDLDWLDLNLKRTSHPDLRPSTQTCIGRVSVEDPEGLLRPKTDRIGFVEDGPFEELRDFAVDAVLWLSRRREKDRDTKARGEKKSTGRRVQKAKEHLEKTVGAVPGEVGKAVVQAVKDYEQAKEDEANTLREELQLYRTLCTAGATAATFAHQARGALGGMMSSANMLVECMTSQGLLDRQIFSEVASDISAQAGSLLALSRATLDLLLHEKRRRGRVSIHATIDGVAKILGPYLRQREVEIFRDYRATNDRVLASQAAIESIVANLILNSLQAFSRDNPGERKISFETFNIGETIRLNVEDSGPGIVGISIEDIWTPGQTTTPEGTGLGLSIVRAVAEEMKGSARAWKSGKLGGAFFQIDLPVRG